MQNNMIRLDKYLTECGVGTRSDVKKIIRQGRIKVNNENIKGADFKVNPNIDIVLLDDNEIVYEQYSYYIFHKPGDCITANSDSTHKTIMEYLPNEISKKCSAVGRLDKDTEGLLLLTNDGKLSHQLRSPSNHVAKKYYCRLDNIIPDNAVESFKKGVDIGDDKLTKPAELVILDEKIPAAYLTITEGRYHQVKRMFHAIGCEVIYLKRLTIGNISLGDLPIGEYRKLSEDEILSLKSYKELNTYE